MIKKFIENVKTFFFAMFVLACIVAVFGIIVLAIMADLGFRWTL